MEIVGGVPAGFIQKMESHCWQNLPILSIFEHFEKRVVVERR